MKKIIRSRSLWLIIFFLLWGFSFYLAESASRHNNIVSINYSDKELVQRDFVTAIGYEEKNSNCNIDVNLINNLENQIITNLEKEENVLTTVVEMYGDMTNILPYDLIAGSAVDTEDIQGCVIDKDSAFQLFGTSYVVGNSLIWGKNIYVIRGVIDSKDKILFVYEPNKNHKYQYVEMYFIRNQSSVFSENKSQKELVSTFIKSYGFGTPEILIDGNSIATYMKFICHIPAYIIFIWFIISKFRKWYSNWVLYYHANTKISRQYQNKYNKFKSMISLFIFLFLFIICIMIMLWAGEIRFEIPSELIPNRWTNFQFYPGKIHEIINSLNEISNSKLFYKELLLKNNAYKCIFSIGIALVILVYIYRLNKHNQEIKNSIINENIMNRITKIISLEGAFVQPCKTVITIFIAYLILNKLNIFFNVPRFYWFTLPCYYAIEEMEIMIERIVIVEESYIR